MCGQKFLNLPADLPIVNGIRQFIGLTGCSGICVQDGGNDEFLTQYIFLRKYAMICKHFKILYFNLLLNDIMPNDDLFVIWFSDILTDTGPVFKMNA